jgi:hypothetical protein
MIPAEIMAQESRQGRLQVKQMLGRRANARENGIVIMDGARREAAEEPPGRMRWRMLCDLCIDV